MLLFSFIWIFPLVFCRKLLERVGFACILHDTLDDALAADGVEVGYVSAHHALLLGTVETTGMAVGSLIDIDKLRILGVEDEVAPGHFIPAT